METSEEKRHPPNIEGFKKKDFNPDPDLIGPVPLSIPKDVQTYLKKNHAAFLRDPKISFLTYLYRIMYDREEQKERKQFIQKFKSKVPDEDEIATVHGVGRYRWIANWDGPNGDTGVISEVIEIGEGYVTESGKTVIAGGPTRDSGFSIPLATVHQVQESPLDQLRKLAEISAIMAGNRPVSQELPSNVMEKMMMGQLSFFEKTMDKFSSRMDKMIEEKRSELKQLAAPQEKDSEDMETQPSTAMPEWVTTAMTMLDKYLPQLLGGGFVADAVKTGIQQTDLYKELFHDEAKTTQLAQAMVAQFGEEKTRAVFEVLAKVDAPPAPPAPVASNPPVTETKPEKLKAKK